MAVTLTTEQVWNALENEIFAVLGMVSAKHESRTVGIIYVVRDRKLYIGSGKDTWKVRHIRANSHVSLTVPIAKRVPLMPWFKIPAATITFSGTARILDGAETSQEVLRAIFRGMADDKKLMEESCLIEVTPEGDFITYGVGVPLLTMRRPEQSRGRVSVNGSNSEITER